MAFAIALSYVPLAPPTRGPECSPRVPAPALFKASAPHNQRFQQPQHLTTSGFSSLSTSQPAVSATVRIRVQVNKGERRTKSVDCARSKGPRQKSAHYFNASFQPACLSDQQKPANEYHLKTGQRE